MIEFLFYWVLIGIALCFQHSYRFYVKNKVPLSYKTYLESFKDSKLFYFSCLVLWVFALDFLIEVSDYNKKELVNE